MSFKHDGKRTNNWKSWVNENKVSLTNAGVPIEIYANENRWFHFLEHGYDSEKEWGPRMLNKQEALDLYEFIISEYGKSEYRGLLHEIEQEYNA